jgi:hypothetical protein
MCKGKKACTSCARKSKKHSSSSINGTMKKINLSVLKPAAAGLAGFAVAKFVNKIPKVGENALLSGGVKIALAAIAPGMLGNKIPMIKEVAVGVAIAGVTDIIRQYLPSVSAFIAAPGLPSGNPFARRNTRIACADDNGGVQVKYS